MRTPQIAGLAMTLTCAATSADAAERYRETESQDLGKNLGRACIVEPASRKPQAVFICLHGIQTNRDWWRPIGRELAAQGIAVWAFNRPGSCYPVPPGPARAIGGPWEDQMLRVRKAAGNAYGAVPAYAMGVSWGASPALNAVQKKPREWAGSILLNPAFATTRDDDFERATRSHLWPHRWFSPVILPLTPSDYTSSSATGENYLRPEQLKRSATVWFLLKTNGTKKRAIEHLQTPSRPVLILLGKEDPLVPPKIFHERFDALINRNHIQAQDVPGATHAAIVEPERTGLATRMIKWIRRSSPRP